MEGNGNRLKAVLARKIHCECLDVNGSRVPDLICVLVWKVDQIGDHAFSDLGYDLDFQSVVGGSYGSIVVLMGKVLDDVRQDYGDG